MQFLFYYDESYDGKEPPNTVSISGFFSDQPTWDEVEKNWNEINHRYGVSCFHATDLNGKRGEYSGWNDKKKVCYSAELLESINHQKKRMRAYNCGMRADKYRNIISATGREKLGHPLFACFKSCIAMIAKDMETLPADDSVSVFMKKGAKFDSKVVKFFECLAENPAFEYRHRLMNFTAVTSGQPIGLQVADLMAYEYFKRLSDNKDMRTPLELIRRHNAYEEGFFGENIFKNMKGQIESAKCERDKLVIIPTL